MYYRSVVFIIVEYMDIGFILCKFYDLKKNLNEGLGEKCMINRLGPANGTLLGYELQKFQKEINFKRCRGGSRGGKNHQSV